MLKQRQRIINVQREQERLWHNKIAVVNTIQSGDGVLEMWIGKVHVGTVSNDMFFPAMTNASAGKKD